MRIHGLEKNIGALIEKAANKYGDKNVIYFEYDNSSLTYRELNEKVNRFANVLSSEGIKKGGHVAVMLPNSSAYPLTWLALAKIGAVMVPVNVRYQAHDLEYIINDSDAGTLIIHTDHIPLFREVQPKCSGIKTILRVGDGDDDIGISLIELTEKASTDFKGGDVGLGDLINIQYTSGTTGFPKGCLLTHEYWLTLGYIASDPSFGVTEEDIFLSVQPFFYMDPQWQLIMTITAGGYMILAERYSASGFMDLVRKHGVTCSLAEAAILIFLQPESPLDKEHNLRFLLIFGFPARLHKQFEERFNVAAREAFGMTEIGCGMFVPLEDSHMTGSGSVGRIAPYREIRIVDDDGNDVSQGEVGELLIRGPGLFKGYYKKPKETGEAIEGEWFHTGDLFRQDENGYFYIMGRKKDMVRRSSENISCAEVEHVLDSHPKIMQSAIVPVPSEIRGEEVKAYIIPNPGESEETIPPEEIIEYCKERLAKFKVPRYIEYRDDFPRTPNLRTEKHKLIAEKDDLTSGSYDDVEKRWID